MEKSHDNRTDIIVTVGPSLLPPLMPRPALILYPAPSIALPCTSAEPLIALLLPPGRITAAQIVT